MNNVYVIVKLVALVKKDWLIISKHAVDASFLHSFPVVVMF